ncbi:MAG: SirB2 family protein [Proteobacteria bacterium]|nr:SirB2 family protein [Pseudomonadota bacterium]MBS0462243.1 SirB2 family protein [Pseudomonadota bacterium]MBS0465351.1 SirB2 family protein [Pseudomonadota bacterium]
MAAYYPQIKDVHVGAVTASGVLFLARGIGVQAGARWAMLKPVRITSYVIDTILLIAAGLLTAILQQYPFVDGWLTAKVLWLLVYIGLGTFALKRGRTPRTRRTCFVAALAVYAFIVSIAIAHDPRGVLSWWGA